MTLPRRVVPGRTYLITRRCVQRRFQLKPVPRLTQIFRYCLLYAASRCGIQVHGWKTLSNHWHGLVSDPRGQLPKFMQLLNSLTARALNAHWGRGESFYAPGSFSAVELHGQDAVLDKLVYTLTNAVEAGLVSRPERWPGFRTLPSDVGVTTLTASRPEFFFGERSELPETVSLRITVPPGFTRMGAEAFRQLLERQVEARIQRIRAKRRAEGKRRFLGVRGVMEQRPFDTPGDSFPKFKTNPRIACKDEKSRKLLLAELVAFRIAHRQAWERWRHGDREVLFPVGSYWMRVVYGVRCGPSPPAQAA